MTSTTPRVWLTPQAHHRLRNELTTLLAPRRGSDADFASQRDREARIRQINDLLTNAIVGEDPPDDGVAEPGMVLTVRFDDTGETETFLLGARGAEHGAIPARAVAQLAVGELLQVPGGREHVGLRGRLRDRPLGGHDLAHHLGR